jgi:UDP-glucuronate 4-epimerase
MERAFVTGAAGFIGSHLADWLRRDGVTVVAVDSFSPHYGRALKEQNVRAHAHDSGFTLIEGDLVELPLEQLLEGVDVVFHLAARPGVRDSWSEFPDYLHSNVAATKALLDACVAQGPRLVYASSSSVYGDNPTLPVTEDAVCRPISPYGATKAMAEMMVGAYTAAHGLHAVGIRYFSVYGPRQRPDMGLARFIEAAAGGEPLRVYGDGRQLRDFTYVADAVAATAAAAQRGQPGSVYNVASGRPVELLEVLAELREVIGRDFELVHEEVKLGDVRDTWADISRASSDLGYSPGISLRAGLAAQVEEAEPRREFEARPARAVG